MIRFEEVRKTFEDGTEALKGITVTIPVNKLTVIIGPSGCGKTTLMRMINRLEEPTSGTVYIKEKRVAEQDEVTLRRSIGYVIQKIGLIPHMTASENIALVPKMLGWKQEEIEARRDELLNLVGLDPAIFKERYPFELSGGQQQRVGVVRALASDPSIMLMDEPFSALDPISRIQLQRELKSLQTRIKKTIVFVTHDMDEALEIADYILIMRDGQIEQMATPEELLAHPENTFVREFIGEERIARRLNFGQRTLQEFISFFEVHQEGNFTNLTLDCTKTVKEAVDLMKEKQLNELAITKGSKVIGYLNYEVLVNAAMQEKGKEKPYESLFRNSK